MKNRIIVFSLSLFISALLQAQYSEQYLHLNAGGGMHELSYKTPVGTQKSAAGFSLNAAYSYFFAPNWGVQTGIGLQSYGASSVLNFTTEMAYTDSEGDNYQLMTYYRNWEERQRALLLSIPLAMQFRYPISQKFKLLAAVGANISMPISTKFKTTGGEIETTGMYPQWHLELTDIPAEGFSTTTQNYSGKNKLKAVAMGTVDLGMLYKLTPKMDLYVGAYANYGLNNALTPNTKQIYQKDGSYNGLFASEQVKEVKPIAAGVKIGVYWQLTKKQESSKTGLALDPVTKNNVANTLIQKDTIAVIIPPVVEAINVDYATANIQAPVVTPAIETATATAPDSLTIAKELAKTCTLNFELNSNKPINAYNEQVSYISNYLKANPNLQLYLIGHTCNLGSHRANVKVGMNRARLVKQRFVQMGVSELQITTVSKAYDEPLVPNTSNENRTKNRRVELKIAEK